MRANFFAGDTGNRGGVRVAARDLDGDGSVELLVGSGTGAGSRVSGYPGRGVANGTPRELFAFDALPAAVKTALPGACAVSQRFA